MFSLPVRFVYRCCTATGGLNLKTGHSVLLGLQPYITKSLSASLSENLEPARTSRVLRKSSIQRRRRRTVYLLLAVFPHLDM